MVSRPRVAVIGAGVAGLNCARHLQEAGWLVRVFDKSRGIGGRLSVKRIDNLGSVDLGAQFMTASTREFAEVIEAESQRGRVIRWLARIAYVTPKGLEPATPQVRWIGFPAMNAWLETLWPREQVTFSSAIHALERHQDGTWMLNHNHEETFQAVVLAMPPQQAATLLHHTSLGKELAQIVMNPCWAALCVFERDLNLDFDAAFCRYGGLDWIAANHTKPGRTDHRGAWTIHADAHLSRTLLEASPDVVAPQLFAAFREVLAPHVKAWPQGRIELVHRWRFASPCDSQGSQVFWHGDLGVGACGDWTVGGRVEGAFTAGRLMAAAITANPPKS